MAEKRKGRTGGRKASVNSEVNSEVKPALPSPTTPSNGARDDARTEAPRPAPRTPGMVWMERMREFRGRRERDLTLGIQLGKLEREFRDRQREVGDLVDVWLEVAPPRLREIVSIGGLSQGTLTLVTASSAAGFEASRALREGLERTLMSRFPARVRRVKVKVGGDGA